MLPDLESLRCFEAGATHLTFRVAAKTVSLSPAAFGDRIKRLENLLDARLFARTTRTVALTKAGERLLPVAKRILDDAKRCRDAVHEQARTTPFELAIGTRFELGLSWLTPALRPLRTARPERTIHLVFGDSADLIRRARDGLVDAIVTSTRLTFGGLAYETLHDESYVFVGARKLLRARPLARADQAVDHVLLDAGPDLPLFRYFLDAAGRNAAWSFQRTEYLGTIGAIRARVLECAGVAVLPQYFVARDLAAGRLARILPRARLLADAFRLIWRAGHAREGELRALSAELSALPLR
jgi:DNA-binding transcriptional LysR family regulator